MNILGLGLPELIIIALILLLFFGPKRLPGLFRSIGTSVRELKEGLQPEQKTETDTTSPSSTSENPAEPSNDTNRT